MLLVKAGHFKMMSSHAEMMDSVLNIAKLAGVVAKLGFCFGRIRVGFRPEIKVVLTEVLSISCRVFR
jgi:hypothetical protein